MPYICLISNTYDDAVSQGTFVIDDIAPDASKVAGTYANTALGPLRPQVAAAGAAATIQAYLEAQVADAMNYSEGAADAAVIIARVDGGEAVDAASLNALAGGDLDLNNGAALYTIVAADVTEILGLLSGDSGLDRMGGRISSSGSLNQSVKNGKLATLIADGDVVVYSDDGSVLS